MVKWVKCGLNSLGAIAGLAGTLALPISFMDKIEANTKVQVFIWLTVFSLAALWFMVALLNLYLQKAEARHQKALDKKSLAADEAIEAEKLFFADIILRKDEAHKNDLSAMQRDLGRKARYAEALPHIHRAFHLLRDAWYFESQNGAADKGNRANRDVLYRCLQDAVASFAGAFGIILDVHCWVVLKDLVVIEKDGADKKQGETLSNEEKANLMRIKELCTSDDNTEHRVPVKNDLLVVNDDYMTLFREPKEMCFFSNDLVRHKEKYGFRNSDWNPPAGRPSDIGYKATITWPIQKRLFDGPRPHQLGYLSLRTNTTGVLVKPFDEALGAAFADGLYVLLRTLKPDQN